MEGDLNRNLKGDWNSPNFSSVASSSSSHQQGQQVHNHDSVTVNVDSQSQTSMINNLHGQWGDQVGLTTQDPSSIVKLTKLTLSQEKHQKKHEKFSSQPSSGKCKPSNFHADSLEIGYWKRISRNEGDIVVKIYFAKKIIVWEFLEKSLKSKIEMHWSEISAIKASLYEGKPGCLAIELNQPPQYYKEIPPQPRKHTQWRSSADFTEGQASIFRRHLVIFAPGVLDKHYEKLLQCDNRLFNLSKEPFPTSNSPFFTNPCSNYSYNLNGDVPNFHSQMSDMMHSVTHLNENQRVHTLFHSGPSIHMGERDQLLQDDGNRSLHIPAQHSGSYIPLRKQDHFVPYDGTESHDLVQQFGSYIPMTDQNNLILYHEKESCTPAQRPKLCIRPTGVQNNLIQYNVNVSYMGEQDHTMLQHEMESHNAIQQSGTYMSMRVQDNLTPYNGKESCNHVEQFGSYVPMRVQNNPITYDGTKSHIPVQILGLSIPIEEQNSLTTYNEEILIPVQQSQLEIENMKNHLLSDLDIQMQQLNERRVIHEVHLMSDKMFHQINPNNVGYKMNSMEYVHHENNQPEPVFLEPISWISAGVSISDSNMHLLSLEPDRGSLDANQLSNPHCHIIDSNINLPPFELNQGNQFYDYTNVKFLPSKPDHGHQFYGPNHS